MQLARIGALRCALMATTLLVVCAAPFADGQVYYHDWRLLPSVVAPSVMMMLAFALPLDITMSKVFMVDAGAEERDRLRFVIRLELFAFVLLFAAWSPFIFTVLNFSPFG